MSCKLKNKNYAHASMVQRSLVLRLFPPLVFFKSHKTIARIRTLSRIVWTTIFLCCLSRMIVRGYYKRFPPQNEDQTFLFLKTVTLHVRKSLFPLLCIPTGLLALTLVAIVEITPMTSRPRFIALSDDEKLEVSGADALSDPHELQIFLNEWSKGRRFLDLEDIRTRRTLLIFNKIIAAVPHLIVNGQSRFDQQDFTPRVYLLDDAESYSACAYGASVDRGVILMTSGLLEESQEETLAEREAKDLVVAFVLAHEISHLILSHRLESISTAIFLPQLTGLVFDFLRVVFYPFFIIFGPFIGDGLQAIGKLGYRETFKFSEAYANQWMELEADAVAFQVLQAAGYDMQNVVQALDEHLTSEGRLSHTHNDRWHPAFQKRLERLSCLLDRSTAS